MSHITPDSFREADELLDYVEPPAPEPEPEIKHLLLPLHMREDRRAHTWCNSYEDGTTDSAGMATCCECLERYLEYAS